MKYIFTLIITVTHLVALTGCNCKDAIEQRGGKTEQDQTEALKFIEDNRFYVWGDFTQPYDLEPERAGRAPHNTTVSIRRLIIKRGGTIAEEIDSTVDYVVLGNIEPTSLFIKQIHNAEPGSSKYDRIKRNYSQKWEALWHNAARNDALLIPVYDFYRRARLPLTPDNRKPPD